MEDERDESLVRALPGLARIGASAWWHTLGFAVDTSLRTSSRVLRAAASGEPPTDLFESASDDLRRYLRTLLGEDEDGEEEEDRANMAASDVDGEASPEALRERGAHLLQLSADVTFEEDTHPAFSRILDELAPDEARILRFLASEGAQPAIDVRSGGRLSINSQLVAPGITMIAEEAGCRHLDRVSSYLNNLSRLGLIWFSREELEDLNAYQVLEAQPEVGEAMEEAGRGAKTIRRSILLTPFGEDFCDVCLPRAAS
jgi:hypothetical protein